VAFLTICHRQQWFSSSFLFVAFLTIMVLDGLKIPDVWSSRLLLQIKVSTRKLSTPRFREIYWFYSTRREGVTH
jgi:hypothetical protein